MNDWYDGRIDEAYLPKCYRDAIKNLPDDVRTYSDAAEELRRHLLQAIRKNGGKPLDLVPPQGRGDGPRDGSPGGTGTGTGTGETTPIGGNNGDDGGGNGVEAAPPGDDGGDGGLFGFLRPSNADSVPLPLLVLAGLALLLLAAAAVGFATRRVQARRVRIGGPPGEPPGR